ncbi:hypothetical protein OEZ85_011665 [Tetradesmus obliquus]|uniref:Uncharacterized protein n=1 Tax=Tetradesmus obliquus TaxID=3088 RepID=A0ABY8TTF8_TETOB|nr:hypothetical protein OEZ85_011665 [Tetradesmus obliquus]
MDSEIKPDSARQDAPAGPDTHSSRDQPSGLKGALTPAHSAVGPTGGLFEKTVELLQRFEDTPGDSFKERLDTWFTTRADENAADTGVTWPSARITKMWKFFFKAGQGTTDRYGFCIKMGPMDSRTEAERASARSRSAASLVNIDPQERTRRTTLGLTLVAMAVLVAAALVAAAPEVSSLADAVPPPGSLGPAATAAAAAGADVAWLGRLLLKLALVPPFAFGALLAASGASGL